MENLINIFIEVAHDLKEMLDKVTPYTIKTLLLSLDGYALALTNSLDKNEILKLIETNERFRHAIQIHDTLNNIYISQHNCSEHGEIQ